MSRAEQILTLNTQIKCTLAPSPIHGVGVFSIKPIKKGDRCFVRRMPYDTQMIFDLSWSALQEVDKEVRDIIVARWPNVVNGAQFFMPNDDARLLSFMNFSEQDNYDPRTDLALKDIDCQEELTEDYRIVENYSVAYPFLV